MKAIGGELFFIMIASVQNIMLEANPFSFFIII